MNLLHLHPPSLYCRLEDGKMHYPVLVFFISCRVSYAVCCLEELASQKVPLFVSTFDSLLAACIETGQLKVALKIFKGMTTLYGFAPTRKVSVPISSLCIKPQWVFSPQAVKDGGKNPQTLTPLILFAVTITFRAELSRPL